MSTEIIWNPRRGDTEDDRYYWPEDVKLFSGPTDIYSDPPTIEEVNSGSGINQFIAELWRRHKLFTPGYSIEPIFLDEDLSKSWNWMFPTQNADRTEVGIKINGGSRCVYGGGAF